MKELIDNNETQAYGSIGIAREYRYYCKLFDDMITRTPCLLRRRELNGKSHFSCGGCSKDTVMSSRHNRLRAQLEQS